MGLGKTLIVFKYFLGYDIFKYYYNRFTSFNLLPRPMEIVVTNLFSNAINKNW